MKNQSCTSIPATEPPDAPYYWSDDVLDNCFTNIERLGWWTNGTNPVPVNSNNQNDPSGCFANVTPHSVSGSSGKTPTIYVLTHGWAPGYNSIAAGQPVLWWGANAALDGVWTSDWAWLPTSGVSPTGLLQSISAYDSDASILAYSWIDNSATDNVEMYWDDVYISEAYTHINGIRLANALLDAIDPSFWSNGGVLRLMGHSHGSKVMTVAALTLQKRGYNVAHLTIFDSPDCEDAALHNGANLLGFYLERMQLADPTTATQTSVAPTFVDNYASFFDGSYQGSAAFRKVVEVALDPTGYFYDWEWSDLHAYSAIWYGAAAAAAAAAGDPAVGLAYPPAPASYTPALLQTWQNADGQQDQWYLQSGKTTYDIFSYGIPTSLAMAEYDTTGKATYESPGTITLKANGSNWSTCCASYTNPSHGYGIVVDINWTSPASGDYLVIAMPAPYTHDSEVLLVMDGQSGNIGQTSVIINSCAKQEIDDIYLYVFYFAASGNPNGQVVLSNFRSVTVQFISPNSNEAHKSVAATAEELIMRRAGLRKPFPPSTGENK